jgi:nitroreductase
MKVGDEAYVKYCSFCDKKIRTPVIYKDHVFCSAQCKDSFVSSKEKTRDFTELRSVRSFQPIGISEDVLKSILEAGRHTPSAHNIQPWHFIVVSDPKIKKELAVTGKFVEDSALIIVGCGDPEESLRWYELEVAIALQSMVLAAWMQGVGSCWIDVGSNKGRVKKVLGIPDRLKMVALVAFGYPSETLKPVWKKPLNQIIHHNKF